MKDHASQQLLRDPDLEPGHQLLKSILDRPVYEILKRIEQDLAAAELGLEWRYYKDGKAWLGKVTYRKKTVVWVSVWDGFIKVIFYFTEKTRPGVLDLDLSDPVKSLFAARKPAGKLISLSIDIKDEEGLKDFNTVLHNKKNVC